MSLIQDTPPRLDLGLADLAPDFDLLLCDVWGVVHNGVEHHRAAVDALRRFRQGGGTVILITNAPVPRAQVARRLDALAVPRNAYDDIATSGDVTAEAIVAAGCPPLFNIGPPGEIALYREAARLAGRPLTLTTIEAAELAVCISLDETGERPEDYDAMLQTLRAKKLDLVCANPDIVVEMGHELIFCAGAIAERYEAIGGKVIQAGKPYPAIYERAFAMARTVRGDVRSERTLAIGDALRTDVAGANRQGIAAMLITSGIHRDELQAGGPSIDSPSLARALARASARIDVALPYLVWTL